ncbi:hypothetical protein HMPREF9136_0790 [Prevotella dentalis DSM 3688]|uniref:Uncharacterized protein n=1 Tax=Prevotella dentalis (strain ATCC 49559 / DSM 3688 / JCM 13448 / NCTC 12043 / ES 2772) TaxID=908937 RepID=F9D1R2_PREDD|nr:hypothetical protein HMPREF9136_0790 [Prevotella dentalis DSM 3688]
MFTSHCLETFADLQCSLPVVLGLLQTCNAHFPFLWVDKDNG